MSYNKLKNTILWLFIVTLLLYPLYLHATILNEQVKEQVEVTQPIKTTKVKVIRDYERQPIGIKKEIQDVFGDKWRVAYAVMMAESSGKSKAIGYNNDSRGTYDRGLFQLNSYWHKEVSDSCAYSIKCNIKEAYRVSQHGTNWNQWYTYTKGRYLAFM